MPAPAGASVSPPGKRPPETSTVARRPAPCIAWMGMVALLLSPWQVHRPGLSAPHRAPPSVPACGAGSCVHPVAGAATGVQQPGRKSANVRLMFGEGSRAGLRELLAARGPLSRPGVAPATGKPAADAAGFQ